MVSTLCGFGYHALNVRQNGVFVNYLKIRVGEKISGDPNSSSNCNYFPEMMMKLLLNTRSVFDFLKMAQSPNSVSLAQVIA
jgi:hypothetical protein